MEDTGSGDGSGDGGGGDWDAPPPQGLSAAESGLLASFQDDGADPDGGGGLFAAPSFHVGATTPARAAGRTTDWVVEQSRHARDSDGTQTTTDGSASDAAMHTPDPQLHAGGARHVVVGEFQGGEFRQGAGVGVGGSSGSGSWSGERRDPGQGSLGRHSTDSDADAEGADGTGASEAGDAADAADAVDASAYLAAQRLGLIPYAVEPTAVSRSPSPSRPAGQHPANHPASASSQPRAHAHAYDSGGGGAINGNVVLSQEEVEYAFKVLVGNDPASAEHILVSAFGQQRYQEIIGPLRAAMEADEGQGEEDGGANGEPAEVRGQVRQGQGYGPDHGHDSAAPAGDPARVDDGVAVAMPSMADAPRLGAGDQRVESVPVLTPAHAHHHRQLAQTPGGTPIKDELRAVSRRHRHLFSTAPHAQAPPPPPPPPPPPQACCAFVCVCARFGAVAMG